jgi:hypothetical protein
MKTSQSLNTITHSNTTTTTTNLDSSDWPSLNSELQNADLSLNLTTSSTHHHHNQVTQIPLSKSCNFDAAKQGGADQDDSNSHNNSKKQLQQQQQQQKQIKWKPLIVEPPKRERKSYRNARPRNGETTTSHGGSTSTRRSHRTRSLDRQKNNMENNKSEQGLRDEAAGDADGDFDEEYENTSRNRSTLVKSKSTTHRGLSDSVGLNIFFLNYHRTINVKIN